MGLGQGHNESKLAVLLKDDMDAEKTTGKGDWLRSRRHKSLRNKGSLAQFLMEQLLCTHYAYAPQIKSQE